MSSKLANDAVTSQRFLDEIHHLLWIEPADNEGNWDEGWNCRDHALLAGLVCNLLGGSASIIYGQAALVQGPRLDLPPVGLVQETHAWLGIEGVGFLDIRLRATLICRNRSCPEYCVIS